MRSRMLAALAYSLLGLAAALPIVGREGSVTWPQQSQAYRKRSISPHYTSLRKRAGAGSPSLSGSAGSFDWRTLLNSPAASSGTHTASGGASPTHGAPGTPAWSGFSAYEAAAHAAIANDPNRHHDDEVTSRPAGTSVGKRPAEGPAANEGGKSGKPKRRPWHAGRTFSDTDTSRPGPKKGTKYNFKTPKPPPWHAKGVERPEGKRPGPKPGTGPNLGRKAWNAGMRGGTPSGKPFGPPKGTMPHNYGKKMPEGSQVWNKGRRGGTYKKQPKTGEAGESGAGPSGSPGT